MSGLRASIRLPPGALDLWYGSYVPIPLPRRNHKGRFRPVPHQRPAKYRTWNPTDGSSPNFTRTVTLLNSPQSPDPRPTSNLALTPRSSSTIAALSTPMSTVTPTRGCGCPEGTRRSPSLERSYRPLKRPFTPVYVFTLLCCLHLFARLSQ